MRVINSEHLTQRTTEEKKKKRSMRSVTARDFMFYSLYNNVIGLVSLIPFNRGGNEGLASLIYPASQS